MKKILLFLLIPVLSFSQVQIGDDIDGEEAGDQSGASISLSSNGSIVAIGAPNNDGNGSNSGHVRVYENQGGVWTQIGQDIDGEGAGDQSGASISLSSNGSIVAIGAPNNDGNGSNSGHVRVYENQGGVWTQIGQDIDGEGAGDEFGTSLGLSNNGSILGISADRNSDNGSESGHVRVYENQGGVWTQIGQDIDGENSEDFFGRDISISSDGTIIAIGSFGNDDNGENSGKVSIYEFQENNWVQIGQNINGQADNDRASYVTISGDGSVVTIGSPNNDNNGPQSGQVRVYEFQENNWVQIGQNISGEFDFDGAGFPVISSQGSIIAIGAPGNDNNGPQSGQVKVFDLNDILSTQETLLTTFSIYPNPAKENVTITVSDINTLKKVTIYNNLGQEVLESTQSSVDVSSLSKGVYVIEVQSTTGKASEKFIIQ